MQSFAYPFMLFIQLPLIHSLTHSFMHASILFIAPSVQLFLRTFMHSSTIHSVNTRLPLGSCTSPMHSWRLHQVVINSQHTSWASVMLHGCRPSCHMSHVACHMSHVPCRMSNVACLWLQIILSLVIYSMFHAERRSCIHIGLKVSGFTMSEYMHV